MEIYEIVNMYHFTLIEDFILRIKQHLLKIYLCVLVILAKTLLWHLTLY